ncbi:MAG TPA: hypothetical protein VF403_02385 [Kofleriaceae bacterium]
MQRNSGFEARDYGKLWTHKGNKFVIGTLQGEPLEITAQYNPKELSRSASAAWNVHPNTSARQSASGETNIWMEYKSTEPRSLTLELVFDGYEEGISVAPLVEQLESLTLPKDMSSRTLSDRHPRACVAVWGKQSLRCVVLSVATKLSMFDESGEPLRATCTITLKETDVVAMMAGDKDKSGFQTRQQQVASFSGAKQHEARRHWVDDKPVADAWSKPQASTAPAAKPAPAPTAKPAPAAAAKPASAPAPAPAPVEQKAVPTQTPDSKTPTEKADAQDQQDDDDAAASSPESTDAKTVEAPEPQDNAMKTVGTPSQPFAGDDDLDSPRANPAPTPAKTVGTPSQPFAGDDDLDSPRANPAPAHYKVPADDLE